MRAGRAAGLPGGRLQEEALRRPLRQLGVFRQVRWAVGGGQCRGLYLNRRAVETESALDFELAAAPHFRDYYIRTRLAGVNDFVVIDVGLLLVAYSGHDLAGWRT